MNINYWQDIKIAPKGKNILVYYKNNLGNGRIIIAYYVEKYTEEILDVEYEESGDYCKEKDIFFVKEGWYEYSDNNPDCYSYRVYEGEPTHWMPLPEFKEDKK